MFHLRFFAMLVVCIMFLAVPCYGKDDGGPKLLKSSGKGRLYRSPGGRFYIAELHGSFRDMGRQYGSLLGEEARRFYGELYEKDILKRPGKSLAELRQGADAFYGRMPQMFKEYVDGMAETNGLGVERTRIMTASLPFMLGLGCSSLSAWGDYTGGGPLVVGRNLDLPGAEVIRKYSEFLHVIVFNPEGFGHSVAHIDYIGGLFYQTAFNSKGIFLELQNGQASDRKVYDNRQDPNHILLASLFSASSFVDMDAFFETNRSGAGLIMNVSTPERAAIYEWSTFRTVRRDGKGLISASNDYMDPSWKRYRLPWFTKKNEGIALTVTRRTNLLKLGEVMKGKLTAAAMMKILDTTIPEGGATFPDRGTVGTIYQVVAVPAERRMWLKVRLYSEWEEIDLTGYFK